MKILKSFGENPRFELINVGDSYCIRETRKGFFKKEDSRFICFIFKGLHFTDYELTYGNTLMTEKEPVFERFEALAMYHKKQILNHE